MQAGQPLPSQDSCQHVVRAVAVTTGPVLCADPWLLHLCQPLVLAIQGQASWACPLPAPPRASSCLDTIIPLSWVICKLVVTQHCRGYSWVGLSLPPGLAVVTVPRSSFPTMMAGDSPAPQTQTTFVAVSSPLR